MNQEPNPISGFDRRGFSVEVDLETLVAQRLLMPADGVQFHDHCNCVPCTPAVMKTMWDGPDKGRRAIICGSPDVGKRCNFKVWLDAPFSPRVRYVIQHMYDILKRLEFENAIGMGLENVEWVEWQEEDDIEVKANCPEAAKDAAGGSSGN